MGWQDVAVWTIVAGALLFLLRRFWPRSQRPDVDVSKLVRKRKPRDPPPS